MAIVYETYGSGTTPAIGDTKRMLLVKIGLATVASAGVGLYSGHGSPVGVITPSGSTAFYIDVDDGTLYIWYESAWH